MRFEYAPVIVPAPDDGEPLLIRRPEIMITIHGQNGDAIMRALVDTGADFIVFPMSLAAKLGIPLSLSQGPNVQAFGGQAIETHYADVELSLHVDSHAESESVR